MNKIKGNKKFNTFPNWDKSLLKNSEYIALFPNVMIGLHIDHFYVFWLEPFQSIKQENICKCIMLVMKVLMVKI